MKEKLFFFGSFNYDKKTPNIEIPSDIKIKKISCGSIACFFQTGKNYKKIKIKKL